jgi:lysozyme
MYTENQLRLLSQLRLHEGKRNKPYRDTVGKETIGVGRNLTDVGLRDDEIDYLLINDIKVVENALDARLNWWRSLDLIRQRVLIDMCFNMGINGLMGFKNTLKAIEEHRWQDAYKGMLASKWAKQVGARANRLGNMILTGQDYKS